MEHGQWNSEGNSQIHLGPQFALLPLHKFRSHGDSHLERNRLVDMTPNQKYIWSLGSGYESQLKNPAMREKRCHTATVYFQKNLF
jgi:hypothetical protein